MSQSAASDTVSIAIAAESLFFLGSTLSTTREGDLAERLADAAARVSMSLETVRSATLVLPSVFMLVLGSLLLAAIGGLAPVLPLIASPVVPPPSAAASAGVGLVTAAAAAAAAAARDEVAVAAAYDGAVGGFCGCWAAHGGWRLGGMMTEIYFNDLTARVGVATVAVGIDDGFGFKDSTARVGVATVAVKVNDSPVCLWRKQASRSWYDIRFGFGFSDSTVYLAADLELYV